MNFSPIRLENAGFGGIIFNTYVLTQRGLCNRDTEKGGSMLFKNITILDENFDVRTHMFVGTEGTRIAYIGETEPETVTDVSMTAAASS